MAGKEEITQLLSQELFDDYSPYGNIIGACDSCFKVDKYVPNRHAGRGHKGLLRRETEMSPQKLLALPGDQRGYSQARIR